MDLNSIQIKEIIAFITVNGNGRGQTNAYIAGDLEDVGNDIFERGLCLPSDNKMTAAEQDIIIQIIRNCVANVTPDAILTLL